MLKSRTTTWIDGWILVCLISLFFYGLIQSPSRIQAQELRPEILNLAESPLSGQWQSDDSGTGYRLWQLRDIRKNEYVEGHPWSDKDENGVIIDEGCDSKRKSYQNKNPTEDNLDHDAFSNIRAYDCDSESEKNVGFSWTGNTGKDTILKRKLSYVVGSVNGNRQAFDNQKLEFRLWIPADADIEDLDLNLVEFCDSTIWDTGDNIGSTSLFVEGRDGLQKIMDSEDSCNVLNHQSIDQAKIGGSLARDIFVSNQTGTIEPTPYKQYKLTVEAEVDTHQSSPYANQFQLSVERPANSYLEVGKTQRIDGGSYEAENALSISARLPEEYEERLEILWETTIYLATDPGSGCHGQEKRFIGLYNSNLSSSYFRREYRAGISSRIEISSTERWRFLHNAYTNFPLIPEETIVFDGRQDGKNVDQNAWEYREMKFRRDRIYRLRIYNLDQATPIQIGLPYNQLNTLQQCLNKALLKVYYSDISVGGRFGLGMYYDACAQQDMSNVTPAGISTHDTDNEAQVSSSAEYAVRATGGIRGFYSNFHGNASELDKSNKLTFANTGAGLPARGGYFGGNNRCIPNYWQGQAHLTPRRDTEVNLGNNTGSQCRLNIRQNSSYFYQPPSKTFTLRNDCDQPARALQLKATIYIDGDLFIENDIINSDKDTKWDKFNQIGYIYLVVKGDILIKPEVGQIDAILVALPGNEAQTQKGRIYTCYAVGVNDAIIEIHPSWATNKMNIGNSDYVPNQTYDNRCDNKLIINGALVARQVYLGRTVAEAKFNEPDPTVTEEINLLPEYFIGAPQLPVHRSQLHGSDSFQVLPINF